LLTLEFETGKKQEEEMVNVFGRLEKSLLLTVGKPLAVRRGIIHWQISPQLF
jgi:hypothetical protein